MSSLQEKLSNLSKEVNNTKAKEAQKLQEEELVPIRFKIEELKKTKYQLELLLGSLKLKSGQGTGKGMREYSSETENEFENENMQLDHLINKNKEALKTIGIEDKNQLLENPDFAKDQEIVSYKKSKAKKEDLEVSDSDLQDRLSSFGININQENFSYDSAEAELEKKIEQVTKELLKEKVKTPEGKEEAKEELIQSLDKKIGSFSFSKAKDFNYNNKKYVLHLGGYNDIEFNEDSILRANTPGSFGVGEWEKMEEEYPYDVIRESMKKIFDKRVTNASYSYDLLETYDRETEELKKYKDIIQSKFLPMANSMLDRIYRHEELRYEAKKMNLGQINNVEDLKRIISGIETNKKDASDVLGNILRIEAELPDEEVILSGTNIMVPSANEQYLKFQKENTENEKKLKEINGEIRKLEVNEPKYFGKEKWNNNLSLLRKEEGELKKLVDRKYYTEENNKNYQKAYIYIPTKEYSYIRKIVENHPRIQANSKEIFNDLKIKLQEEIDKKVPEDILKLQEEFKDLVIKKD